MSSVLRALVIVLVGIAGLAAFSGTAIAVFAVAYAWRHRRRIRHRLAQRRAFMDRIQQEMETPLCRSRRMIGAPVEQRRRGGEKPDG